MNHQPSPSLTTLRQGTAERCKTVAGGRSEAETPGRSPSKKGRHPEGVPQKVHGPNARPNLEVRVSMQRRFGVRSWTAPVPWRFWDACQVSGVKLLMPERSLDWWSGTFFQLPMTNFQFSIINYALSGSWSRCVSKF